MEKGTNEVSAALIYTMRKTAFEPKAVKTRVSRGHSSTFSQKLPYRIQFIHFRLFFCSHRLPNSPVTPFMFASNSFIIVSG